MKTEFAVRKPSYPLSTKIFSLATFLIPFDNLVIAPSAGWATISPFLYLLSLVTWLFFGGGTIRAPVKGAAFIALFVTLQLALLLHYGLEVESVVSGAFTIVLGMAFVASLWVQLITRERELHCFLIPLYWGYCAALLYGAILYVAHEASISPVMAVLESLQKRSYGDRFALSFTEPSFASMHVFGVLYFAYFWSELRSRTVRDGRVAIKFRNLLVVYILVCFFFVDSTRFKIDLIVFLGILGMLKFWVYFRKLSVHKMISMITCVLIIFALAASNGGEKMQRINNIFSHGITLDAINSDASLASRFFRMNALYNGLASRPGEAALGYGLGNASIPFFRGLGGAVQDYDNNYETEVSTLSTRRDDQYFCFHLRVIAEAGFFVWCFLLIALFRRRLAPLFLIWFWLYIQFDSYAFFTIWFYFYLLTKLPTFTPKERPIPSRRNNALLS